VARLAPATSPRQQRPPTVTATGGVVQGAATSPLPLRPPLPAPGSTAADRRPLPPPEFRVLAPTADYRLALVRRPDLVVAPRTPERCPTTCCRPGRTLCADGRAAAAGQRGLHAAACAAARRISEACRRQPLASAGRGGGSQRLQQRW